MAETTDVRPIDAQIAQDANMTKVWRLAMMALADRVAKWAVLLMVFSLFGYCVAAAAPWRAIVASCLFSVFPVLMWWREMFPEKEK